MLYPSHLSLRSTLFVVSMLCAWIAALPARAHEEIFRRTSLDAVVHWEDSTVRIPVDPELVRRFGPGVRALLEEATQVWDIGENVPTLELVHEVTESDRKAADKAVGNWVGFAKKWTYGDKLAVTVSTFDSATGVVISTQVWINPKVKFAFRNDAENKSANHAHDSSEEGFDLQGVLAHEFGHVLGLGEAFHAPDATMFPTFQRGETHQRTLSEVDEGAVDDLYTLFASETAGGSSLQDASTIAASHCATSVAASHRTSAWSSGWFALAILTSLRRRARTNASVPAGNTGARRSHG